MEPEGLQETVFEFLTMKWFSNWTSSVNTVTDCGLKEEGPLLAKSKEAVKRNLLYTQYERRLSYQESDLTKWHFSNTLMEFFSPFVFPQF
jgi:hypothetical protein